MTADVVIRNGQLLLPDRVLSADVVVESGKISALTKDSSSVSADTTLDAKGMYVLPGAIDPHVHFGIYSGSFEKDVETETRSMALGGVTTPVHYLQENGSYLNAIDPATRTVEQKALVDVALQVILMNQGHLDEMASYPKRGISAGKIYMNGKEYRIIGIESDVDDAFLYRAFNLCNKLGFLPKLHCENYELAKAIGEQVQKEGRQGLAAWDAFRPAICEEEAMRRAYAIAGYTGTRFYIVHNTTAAAESLSEQAVREGREVWFETCPHYLTFTCDDDIGILGKVNPPIRSKEHRESLWSALKRGLIQTMGSDHAPNHLDAKKGNGDIWTALLGFGGSAFIFPTLFTEGVERRGLDPTVIPRVTSFNASRAHGITGKGLLAPGYDADIVIIDAEHHRKVEPSMVQSYADYTLYDGRRMTGWPTCTISSGRVVTENLEVVAKPGAARVARCATAKAS
jgi:dihydropyrimidinase